MENNKSSWLVCAYISWPLVVVREYKSYNTAYPLHYCCIVRHKQITYFGFGNMFSIITVIIYWWYSCAMKMFHRESYVVYNAFIFIDRSAIGFHLLQLWSTSICFPLRHLNVCSLVNKSLPAQCSASVSYIIQVSIIRPTLRTIYNIHNVHIYIVYLFNILMVCFFRYSV